MALRALLGLTATPRPDLEALRALERQLTERTRAAEKASYRIEAFLEPTEPPERTRS